MESNKFDETIFKTKIDQDVKNHSQLNNMFTKISKSDNDSSTTKQTAFNLMNNIQEENESKYLITLFNSSAQGNQQKFSFFNVRN